MGCGPSSMDSTRFVNWPLLSALFFFLNAGGGHCVAEDVGRVRITDLALPQSVDSSDIERRVDAGLDRQTEQLNLAAPISRADAPPGRIRLVQQSQTQTEPAVTATQQTAPQSETRLPAALFMAAERRSLLNRTRRRRKQGINTDLILGQESKLRAATDAGNLLKKSLSGTGLSAQQRSPIVTNPGVRGSYTGRLLASGSFWVPARFDLDTMLSKIDSRIVQQMTVIKGPYSALHGPGFAFIDVDLLGTRRFESEFDSLYTSSLEYKTNGEQWYGRQTVEGGSTDWGFRLGYGYRTGNDYRTGRAAAGTFFEPETIPASYKSGDLNASIGFDLTPDSRLEFTYLRLDQHDVEFPGLIFDISSLSTNAYEVEYRLTSQPQFDELMVELWHNRTQFVGDAQGSGKRRRVPSLGFELFPFDGTGTAVTDVDSASTGFAMHATWGEQDEPHLTLGVDLRVVDQELNDVYDQRPKPDLSMSGQFQNNFPIPPSRATNPGILFEATPESEDGVRFKAGGRVDWVSTRAQDNLDSLVRPVSEEFGVNDLGRDFFLLAGFLSAEYDVDEHWTVSAGVGHSERAPTLTELYSGRSFLGTLQVGLNDLFGDPELNPERLTQLDVGVDADFENFHASASVFHAWIHEYIAYELTFARPPGGVLNGQQINTPVNVVNTDLATLAGFEFQAELEVDEAATLFANARYVRGTDRTRQEPGRIGNFFRDKFGVAPTQRSNESGIPNEPLPGMPPLESRLGVRLHEPVPNPTRGLELSARIVAEQERVARTLLEERTPGFTIWDVRGYWQARNNLLLIAGIENLTDKFYREHLDYRTGGGVFRPGINFYFSTELTY